MMQLATKEQQEMEIDKEKIQNFINDYKNLSQVHGYDFAPILHAGEKGIIPTLKIIKLEKPNAESKNK